MDLAISLQAVKDIVRFPFRDPQWQNKLLTGSLLFLANSFVPILPALPLLGYYARLMRAGAANTDPERLPEWDNWSDLFTDGLRQLGVLALVLLPMIAVILAGQVLYFVIVFSSIRGAETGGGGVPLAMLFGLMIMMLTILLGSLLMLLLAPFLPVIQAHVAVQRRFGALFDVGGWWKALRANLGGFLVVLLLVLGLYTAVTLLTQVLVFTILLCFVAQFLIAPVWFVVTVILYRLVGQAYGAGVTAAPAVPPAAADAL